MEQRLECTGEFFRTFTNWGTGAIFVWALLGALSHLFNFKPSTFAYGKFAAAKQEAGLKVNQTFTWCFACLPSFAIAIVLLCKHGYSMDVFEVKVMLSLLFVLHYFNRSIVFPLFNTRGCQQFSLSLLAIPLTFTPLNGFLQVNTLLCAQYPQSWIYDVRFILGTVLFVFGFCVNVHSDFILRNLRKPGERNYKIPRGGFFEYVSCANFFGEIVEWFGFAIACWNSWPAWAFAAFTLSFIGSRGADTHRFYQEKFDDYPKNRKAVIPFVW